MMSFFKNLLGVPDSPPDGESKKKEPKSAPSKSSHPEILATLAGEVDGVIQEAIDHISATKKTAISEKPGTAIKHPPADPASS